MLLAAGQPVFTDDLWWHLGLGEAFAQHGPWLRRRSPALHGAGSSGRGRPGSSDVGLFLLWKHAGFTGLRLLHVAWVAGVLALAFSLARRASGSRAVAGAVAIAFVALAAYRLVQLRPDLFSILATLGLYRLLCEGDAPPTPLRIAVAALLFAVWANCHAAFPLGLALLGASALFELAASRLAPIALRAARRARATRLGAAFGAGLLASLVNPSGATCATSRGSAPARRRRRSHASPTSGRASSRGACPFPIFRRRRSRGRSSGDSSSSPRSSCGRPSGGRAERQRQATRRRRTWRGCSSRWRHCSPPCASSGSGSFRCSRWHARRAGASAQPRRRSLAVLLAPAFFRLGDWPMVSAAMPLSRAGYAEPYSAGKYYAHAIWFLQDAGLEGRVFTDYPIGGFVGFFGAPRLRAFVNGSLNVRRDAMDANRSLRERRGARPGETFPELLDRMQIDLFVGTRLPEWGRGRRPWFYTTAHLEGVPGWIPVFRNADSAVYLRADARNERESRTGRRLLCPRARALRSRSAASSRTSRSARRGSTP